MKDDRILAVVLSLCMLVTTGCGGRETSSKKDSSKSSKSSDLTEVLAETEIPEDAVLASVLTDNAGGSDTKLEYYYNADGTVRKTLKYSRDDDESEWEISETTEYKYYNYYNLLTEETSYHFSDGEKTYYEIHTYSYNADGTLNTETSYSYSFSEDKVGTRRRYTFSYNSDGTLASKYTERYLVEKWVDDGSITYTYSNGLLTEEYHTVNNGSPYSFLYTYNTEGQLVEELKDFGSAKEKVTYEYDDSGNLIRETGYKTASDTNSDGESKMEQSSQDVYTYSKNGVLLEESIARYYNIHDKTVEYSYESLDDMALVSLRDMYGMNDEINLPLDMAAAYSNLIDEYETTYGKADIKDETDLGLGETLVGLCYINLLDFDGDDTPELLLAYRDKDEPDVNGKLKVFTFKDCSAQEVYEGNFSTGGDAGSSYIEVVNLDDVYYIAEIFYGGQFEGNFYSFENGSFSCTRSASTGSSNEYIIDGTNVSTDEFQEFNDKVMSGWIYELFAFDFTNQFLMIDTMKEYIQSP